MRASLPDGGHVEADKHGNRWIVKEYYPGGSLKSVHVKADAELPAVLKAHVAKRGTADPSFRHVRDAGEVLI